MADEKKQGEDANHSGLKPDPGTTHTTDPQENMEGPVSSLMHETGHAFESDKSKQEADEKRDSKM